MAWLSLWHGDGVEVAARPLTCQADDAPTQGTAVVSLAEERGAGGVEVSSLIWLDELGKAVPPVPPVLRDRRLCG